MILLTKSPGRPKSFQEAPRKLQKIAGRKPFNIFVAFLVETMTPKKHFEINWPLVEHKKAVYICLDEVRQQHSFFSFILERVNVFGETFLARFSSIKAYGEKWYHKDYICIEKTKMNSQFISSYIIVTVMMFRKNWNQRRQQENCGFMRQAVAAHSLIEKNHDQQQLS